MASITTDASATPMQRADELLREMTIEEKAMQLSSVVPLALLGTDGPMPGQMDSPGPRQSREMPGSSD